MKTTVKYIGVKMAHGYDDVPISDAEGFLLRERLIRMCSEQTLRMPQKLVLELARDGAEKTKLIRKQARENAELCERIGKLEGTIRKLQAEVSMKHANWPE